MMSGQQFRPVVATKRQPLRPNKSFSSSSSLVWSSSSTVGSEHEHVQHNRWRSIGIFVVLFSGGLLLMTFVFSQFPDIEKHHWDHIKLPRSLDDAKDLGRVLSHYGQSHYFSVLLLVVCTYIFLQSFAIPGSIFLSILSGFLFSFPVALFLVCFCSAAGATFCYCLSALIGVGLVKKHFPDKVASWRQQVAKHRDNMLSYIVFLRITPFLPNWFINIASPLLNIPINIFFFGTFIGVAPPSILFIQAGKTLYKLTTTGDITSWKSMLFLAISAAISLLPVLFKKAMRKKLE
ncbi:transmembrane protein 41B-like [Corticium candelabrum]|uniref:transmembrane protein 41B-like n=1 Tax=Corticium candelabrum TaxID=121492 RepID=UPI002E25F140|nr:transmembrane protein 41B-like [Corticium candelabrum]